MNYAKIASDFLKWVATQKSDKSLAELLKYYLGIKYPYYEQKDYNKILYIARETIRRLPPV